MISRILFLISMISGSLLLLQSIPLSYADYWSDLLDPCVGTRDGSGLEFLRPSYCDETSSSDLLDPCVGTRDGSGLEFLRPSYCDKSQPYTPSTPSGNVPTDSRSQIPYDGSSTYDTKLEELRNINEEYKIKSEQIKSEHCAKMNIIGNMRIGPTTEKYWDSYCEVWRYR